MQSIYLNVYINNIVCNLKVENEKKTVSISDI